MHSYLGSYWSNCKVFFYIIVKFPFMLNKPGRGFFSTFLLAFEHEPLLPKIWNDKETS